MNKDEDMTYNLMNFPEIRDFFQNLDFEKSTLLLQSNIKYFNNIYGKSTKHFKDSSGTKVYYWKVNHKGHDFYIFSAPGRGTSYEVSDTSMEGSTIDDLKAACRDFMFDVLYDLEIQQHRDCTELEELIARTLCAQQIRTVNKGYETEEVIENKLPEAVERNWHEHITTARAVAKEIKPMIKE